MQSSGPKRCLPSRVEWRWAIAFASLVIHIITDGVTYSLGLFYGKFLQDLDQRTVASAFIASTFLGLSLCAVSSIHWITRKYGCRRIVIAGSILASVSLLACSFAMNFVTLYLTIGIGAGLGFAMIYLPAMISVTSYFKDDQHLFGSGTTSCGSGLGLVIFAPLIHGLLISNQTHWQLALLVISALVQLFCVTFGSILRPKNDDKEPKRDDVSSKINNQQRNNDPVYEDVHHNVVEDIMIYDEPYSTVIASPRVNPTANKHPEGGIWSVVFQKAREFSVPFKDPVFDLFLFSKFCTGFGIYIPYIFLVVQAEALKVNNCYLLLSMIGILNLISYTATAYVSKRIWIEWIFVHNGCLIVNGILTLLSILCKDFATLILYCTMYGITSGAYLGLTPVTLGNYLEVKFLDRRHECLLFFQGLGAFLGPPIAGFLCDAKVSYSNAFALGGSMTAIGGLVLFLRPLIERYFGRGQTNTRVYDDCHFQT